MLPTPKAAALLKTPTVMDGVITTGKKNPVSGNSGTLAQEIASGFVYRRGILPTPTTQEIAHPDAEISPTGRRLAKNGNGNSHSMGLADLAHNELLPTPLVGNFHNGRRNMTAGMERKMATGWTVELNDRATLGLLPTPVVCLDGVYADKNPNSKRHSMSIATMAYHGMLPTPRANRVNGLDLYNPKIANRNNGNLEEAISAILIKGLMPTPTTSSRNGGTAKEREDGVSRRSELNHLVAQECGTTSQLSPLFVEEMMGFPTGWILLPFLKESSVPREPSPSTVGEQNR
jgi:hypothetical protein